MARGAAGERPHSPESEGEAAAVLNTDSALLETGPFFFPKNPFMETLDLTDVSDEGEDLDNNFAAIAPQVEVIFDPPARRPSVGFIPASGGNASPITESETESIVGDSSTGWSAVRGPLQRGLGDDGFLLPQGPVTTVDDKGVLVITQGAETSSSGSGDFPQLSRVRTRRSDQPLTGRLSTDSTPGVGAEYVSPTSMLFAPQSGTRYRTPKEVPEAVFSPVASEFREAQNQEIVVSSPSALSPEGQRLAAAWTEQALRETGQREAVLWSAISNNSLVSRPLPEDVGTVLCYIVREKDSLYRLYTQQGVGRPDRLLLLAKEHKRGGKSDFTIATTSRGLKSREPEDGFVGSVQGNVLGTRFEVTGGEGGERTVLAATSFQGSSKKLSGDYRRMSVAVPKPVVVQPGEGMAEAPVGSLTLPTTWTVESRSEQTAVLTTKVPYVRRVNGVTQHYLPYHGRCRLPSVKNFQLVYEEEQEHVVLMFGKDSKHTYCMDYSWPLCAHQAFGISLASIATKLCYAI